MVFQHFPIFFSWKLLTETIFSRGPDLGRCWFCSFRWTCGLLGLLGLLGVLGLFTDLRSRCSWSFRGSPGERRERLGIFLLGIVEGIKEPQWEGVTQGTASGTA